MPHMEYDTDIIGYKKLEDIDGIAYICTLLIPKGSAVYSDIHPNTMLDLSQHRFVPDTTVEGFYFWDFKLRAEQAEVLEIERLETGNCVDEVLHLTLSREWGDILYTTGDMVFPQKEFDTKEEQCASGIHFFPERWMAEMW